MIHPNDLISLPKGQAFSLLDGGHPYKIRLPLADSRDFKGMPDTLTKVAKDMQAKYASSDDWYRFTPSWGRAG